MTLAIITSYFNPTNCKIRLQNYRIFRRKLEENGYKLFTIELIYGKNQPEIIDAKHIYTEDFLWSKENLLNIMVNDLPKEYTKVAWLDCDIVFMNQTALLEAEKVLETKKIVQLFDKVLKLPSPDDKRNKAIYGTSCCKLYLDNNGPEEMGECGFAWAARREFFPLYDKCIIGGADSIIFNSVINNIDWINNKITLSKHHRFDIERYFYTIQGQFSKDDIGYIPGVILHINHGKYDNRNYTARNSILSFFDFDPVLDITYKNNLLVWTNKDNEIHQYIKDYFINRQEDDTSVDLFVDKKCSVVILSWKRPNNIVRICNELSKYESIKDIIVFNNNYEYQLNFKANKTRIINSSSDFGLMSRLSASSFASSEIVVFIDDDIIPSEHSINKLLYYTDKKNDMCSLHGRLLGPNSEYNSEDYFGYCPIVLTRCLAVKKKTLNLILDEQRIWQNENKAWEPANNFPADDIFLSLGYTSVTGKKPFAVNSDYTDLSNNESMFDRPGVKETRQKTILELKRFFNTDNKTKFDRIKYGQTVKLNNSKYNIVTVCPSVDKACGVGNFAKNMIRYMSPYINSKNEPIYLIQHEHGLYKDTDELKKDLTDNKYKKILFAHSPGVEFLENYVDAFVQMCPGMIDTKKPLYTMRHPGFLASCGDDTRVSQKPFRVGTCGFINTSRDFPYILEKLIPHAVKYNWEIELPLSLHENHLNHPKYIELEHYLTSLSKNYENIHLDTRFKTQEELFVELQKINVGWCWTNTPSRKYGSGTASDLYCGVNKLVVANKEQHMAVFDIDNVVIVAPNSLEKFTDILIDTCLNYTATIAPREILSWEYLINDFIGWVNTL